MASDIFSLPPHISGADYTKDGYAIYDVFLTAHDMSALHGTSPEGWFDLMCERLFAEGGEEREDGVDRGEADLSYDGKGGEVCLVLDGFIYDPFEIICWLHRRVCSEAPKPLSGMHKICDFERPIIELLAQIVQSVNPLAALYWRRNPALNDNFSSLSAHLK